MKNTVLQIFFLFSFLFLSFSSENTTNSSSVYTNIYNLDISSERSTALTPTSVDLIPLNSSLSYSYYIKLFYFYSICWFDDVENAPVLNYTNSNTNSNTHSNQNNNKIITTININTRFNYALLTSGAKILSYSTNTLVQHPSNILEPSDDKYLLYSCNNKIWIILQLAEIVQMDTFTLLNKEFYSGKVKDFMLLGSSTYPTEKWVLLGSFLAENTASEQIFLIKTDLFIRYLKIRIISQYPSIGTGTDRWCSINNIGVYGANLLDSVGGNSLIVLMKLVNSLQRSVLQLNDRVTQVNSKVNKLLSSNVASNFRTNNKNQILSHNYIFNNTPNNPPFFDYENNINLTNVIVIHLVIVIIILAILRVTCLKKIILN